jgi:hypothetical protein
VESASIEDTYPRYENKEPKKIRLMPSIGHHFFLLLFSDCAKVVGMSAAAKALPLSFL